MPTSSRTDAAGPTHRRAAHPPKVMRLRMASRRQAVGPTVERIIDAVDPAGLGEDQKLDLAVALSEALSNAAVHGNRLHPRAQVAITIRITAGQQAQIEVKDSGSGFDASCLFDPTDGSRLLAPSGRGVFLMKRLVDRVEFFPPGNRVCLTVDSRP